jgi:hypothetical protein
MSVWGLFGNNGQDRLCYASMEPPVVAVSKNVIRQERLGLTSADGAQWGGSDLVSETEGAESDFIWPAIGWMVFNVVGKS